MTLNANAARFRLGKWVFDIKGKSTSLLETLAGLFPKSNSDGSSGGQGDRKGSAFEGLFLPEPGIVDLCERLTGFDVSVEDLAKTEPNASVVYVINEALRQHRDCIWLDAAVLRTSEGKLLLISGDSNAGKTSLSLALSLYLEWKSASEDLALLDVSNRALIPFASPFSLRPRTDNLVYEATGKKPEPLIYKQWFFREKLTMSAPCPANFDIAVHLAESAEGTNQLSLEKVGVADYIRALIKMGNVLRFDNGAECLEQCLKSTECWVLKGGSLKERIEKIQQIS